MGAMTINENVGDNKGCSGFYEPDFMALERLDALICEAMSYRRQLAWAIPSLIDETTLQKCGYLSAFPAQLTIAATVANAGWSRLAQGHRLEASDIKYEQRFLSPAACLNVYPLLAAMGPAEQMAVTVRSLVFRRESSYDYLLRSWEFPVREFVFVGSEESVQCDLRIAVEHSVELARELKLETSIEAASDHFYPTLANEVRLAMQRQLELKRELVVEFGGRRLPLASFNYHRTHFSRAFGFDRDNTIVTGCVGFGLHRWLACTQRSEK